MREEGREEREDGREEGEEGREEGREEREEGREEREGSAVSTILSVDGDERRERLAMVTLMDPSHIPSMCLVTPPESEASLEEDRWAGRKVDLWYLEDKII